MSIPNTAYSNFITEVVKLSRESAQYSVFLWSSTASLEQSELDMPRNTGIEEFVKKLNEKGYNGKFEATFTPPEEIDVPLKPGETKYVAASFDVFLELDGDILKRIAQSAYFLGLRFTTYDEERIAIDATAPMLLSYDPINGDQFSFNFFGRNLRENNGRNVTPLSESENLVTVMEYSENGKKSYLPIRKSDGKYYISMNELYICNKIATNGTFEDLDQLESMRGLFLVLNNQNVKNELIDHEITKKYHVEEQLHPAAMISMLDYVNSLLSPKGEVVEFRPKQSS